MNEKANEYFILCITASVYIGDMNGCANELSFRMHLFCSLAVLFCIENDKYSYA